MLSDTESRAAWAIAPLPHPSIRGAGIDARHSGGHLGRTLHAWPSRRRLRPTTRASPSAPEPPPQASPQPQHQLRLAVAAALVVPPGVRARLPNWLTFGRVAAVPLLAVAALAPGLREAPLLSAGIFGAAAVTDWLDGQLARRWGVESALGRFLDPVADKLLVAVALVVLTARFPTAAVAAPACVIVSRELFVSALREWMALRAASAVVQVSVWGKVKTAMQMAALAVLLGVSYLATWYARAALVGLAASALLALVSAVDYTLAARRALAGKE